METNKESTRDRWKDVAALDDTVEDLASGRLPSLAAQMPGLDTEQEARTLGDAKAYFEDEGTGGSDDHTE